MSIKKLVSISSLFFWIHIFLNPFQLSTFSAAEDQPSRTTIGLQALYDFRAIEGNNIQDQSGAGEPVDFELSDESAVMIGDGYLEVKTDTIIRSKQRPVRIIKSVQWSGEFSIEAWIEPTTLDQSGPARIITLSRNSSRRNFTLGQDGDKFDVRFRSTSSDSNGLPSLNTNQQKIKTEKTHVVYTRDRSGLTRLYLNNRLVNEKMMSGDLSNWDDAHFFALANEIGGGRAWKGKYFLIAIYNRDLQPGEVANHFAAGTNFSYEDKTIAINHNEKHFEDKVAPILMNHCMECHDSSTKKGGLDLSNKTAAFAGGDNGSPIVPGEPDESMIFTMVNMDIMPLERTLLTQEEKDVIKQWVENGAEWTHDTLDPTALAHGSKPGDVWLQRLTIPEYIETVHSTLGVDIEKEARELLPKDLRADGFSNTAYNLNIDLKHVESYAKLAEIIVSRMNVPAFASQYTNSQRLTDKNMRSLVEDMGYKILRGPLMEHEIALYRGISTTAASAGKNFVEAVSLIVEAMLQSPRFLYRIENQRGDGNLWQVGPYELASRLSYIIWGAPPDDELMRAAKTGELLDPSTIENQVNRMMYDSRTIKRSQQFIAEWLNLGSLANLRPNQEKFPDWKAAIASDMRKETLAYFHDVVWKQNKPLSALLDSQVTYLTPRLAEHYGIPSNKEEFSRYDLSNIPSRGGLLTQGSVLTKGGDEASMVTRGLFVLHDVLRGSVKDPPPCVDTTPVPSKPGLTQRGIAQQRIDNPACGGCHSKFEPLAFGLEKFDGLGTYHDKDEHGNELRDDGNVVYPNTGETVSYQTSEQLMKTLAGSERVAETITWKLTQYAMGRPLTLRDVPILEKIHHNALQDGGTYTATIKAIVMSDLIQKTQTEAYQ